MGPLKNYEVINKVIEFNTTHLIFDLGLANRKPNNSEIVVFKITQPFILTNQVNRSMLEANILINIPMQFRPPPVEKQSQSSAQNSLLAAFAIVMQAGLATTSTTSSMVGLASLLNIFSGASLSFLWSLLNAIQMYEFMPLAQVNTPDFVYKMVQKFCIAKFDFLPKEDFMNHFFNTTQCYDSYMPNFQQSTQQSTNFFFNQTDFVIIIFLMAVYLVCITILHFLCKRKTKYFFIKLKDFRFNIVIRLLVEYYMPLMVSSLITVSNKNLSNSFEVISYLTSLMIIIILLLFFALSTSILIMRFIEINYQKYYYLQRFGALYEELKTTRKVYMMYHPIFFLNRTIIAFALVYLLDNFYFQIWMIIISQSLMMIYLMIFKPFKERSKNILEIFNETCIFFSSCVLFTFSQMNGDDESIVKFGWLFISILMLNVTVNVLKGVIESIINFKLIVIDKCLNKCKKKSSVAELKIQIQQSQISKMDRMKKQNIMVKTFNQEDINFDDEFQHQFNSSQQKLVALHLKQFQIHQYENHLTSEKNSDNEHNVNQNLDKSSKSFSKGDDSTFTTVFGNQYQQVQKPKKLQYTDAQMARMFKQTVKINDIGSRTPKLKNETDIDDYETIENNVQSKTEVASKMPTVKIKAILMKDEAADYKQLNITKLPKRL